MLAAVVWAGTWLAGSGSTAASTGAPHQRAAAARDRGTQQQQQRSRSSSSGGGDRSQDGQAGPELLTYKVVNEFPHDPEAFTQGLQFDRACEGDGSSCKDVLWESTGGWVGG